MLPAQVEETKETALQEAKTCTTRFCITSGKESATVVDSDYEYYTSSLEERNDQADEDMMMTEFTGHRQLLGRFVDDQKNTLIKKEELALGNRRRTPTAVGDFNGNEHSDVAYFGFEGLSFLLSVNEGPMVESPGTKKEDTFCTFYNGGNTDVYNLVGDINNDGLDDILFVLTNRAIQI